MTCDAPLLAAVLSVTAALLAGCGADDPGDTAIIDGAVQPGSDAAQSDRDAAPCDVASVSGVDDANLVIPDRNTAGIQRVIALDASCDVQVTTVQIRLDITHTYRGDLDASVTAPGQEVVDVLEPARDPINDVHQTFDLAFTAGQPAGGEWILTLADVAGRDSGTLDRWSIGINEPAP